ncbi:rCG58378, isoform CRA_b [Rattus norvegicus]|uniref:RCG58378, isoform CRA_b n=1 Tax=Rattus norvegicus TaxID=10116 RepID=A6J564_RAT|nr:rCG58378, isoform CRA_b [Rattus norvegicus]
MVKLRGLKSSLKTVCHSTPVLKATQAVHGILKIRSKL